MNGAYVLQPLYRHVTFPVFDTGSGSLCSSASLCYSSLFEDTGTSIPEVRRCILSIFQFSRMTKSQVSLASLS